MTPNREVCSSPPDVDEEVSRDHPSLIVIESDGRHGAGAPCSEEGGGWGPRPGLEECA